ncbi:hypothetical protein WJX73_002954 [Symbiochloris irregularis]|uniref:PPM-type phosphatase domain-containing protein n=1 Tax=Symbiochloris irregularis TaxID=706552 RepID=A0AAW1PU48_9CHLO
MRAADRNNQDALFTKEFATDLDNKALLSFGIFDGHGPHGREISQALSKLLPVLLSRSESWKNGAYKEALQSTIPACSAVFSDSGLDCSESGSTAVVAALDGNCRLTVANLGTSCCFVGGVHQDGECYSVSLSTRSASAEASRAHHVSKARLEGLMSSHSPAQVKQMSQPDHSTAGGDVGQPTGSFEASGLDHPCQPDMTEYQISCQDRYLVLCSNGMTEYMSEWRMVLKIHLLAQAGYEPQVIASRLVSEARRRWINKSPKFIDDCTIIVILLDGPSCAHSPIGSSTCSAVSRAMTTHDILRSPELSNNVLLATDPRILRSASHAETADALDESLLRTDSFLMQHCDEPLSLDTEYSCSHRAIRPAVPPAHMALLVSSTALLLRRFQRPALEGKDMQSIFDEQSALNLQAACCW